MAIPPTSLVNSSPPRPTPTTSTLTFALSTPPRSTSPSPPSPATTTTTTTSPHNIGSVLHSHRQSYIDGVGAVVLFFLSTLLICGLQRLTASISDFPAPILAMVLVAAVMILAAQFVTTIDKLYARHLRGPTDLLNRHMSIGFTVPFTMIMKEPMPSSRNIGLIIAGYIITGLLNAVLAYIAAYGVQVLLLALPPLASLKLNSTDDTNAATAPPAQPAQSPNEREKTESRIRSYLSDATTLAQLAASRGSPPSNSVQETEAVVPATTPPAQAITRLCRSLPRVAGFSAANPLLCTSLAATALVGIPIAAATGEETALDVFVLVALWTGTLVVQAAVGGAGTPRRNRWRPVLAALCNAVLWCSLGNMAYLAAKAAARHHATADVLAAFHTDTTLADQIHEPTTGSTTLARSFGAGDLAVSILDAGIVSWGLKLFECRAQLLSRAGCTTLAAGAALAVVNVVCWPVLVHGMGLTPASRALAFAARGVTLALAGPAMARLGGDVGLNAAMVVFNGIVFQVTMGLIDAVRKASKGGVTTPRTDDIEAAVPEMLFSSSSNHGDDSSPEATTATTTTITTTTLPDGDTTLPRRGSATSSGGDTLAESITPATGTGQSTPSSAKSAADIAAGTVNLRGGASDPQNAAPAGPGADEPATVALGTTVGINAAAMGTAYLYENDGRAAPYAALSMTVFGVMTVIFASIQPLAGWIIAQTA